MTGRRRFLGRLLGMMALPAAAAALPTRFERVLFKGKPFVFDEHTTSPVRFERRGALLVQPATGQTMRIVGIAARDVRKGDCVEAIVLEPVTFEVQR